LGSKEPSVTKLYHFTHMDNLSSIIRNGLLSDTETRSQSLLEVEAGEPAIKERRRGRVVPVPPGGVVGDYVPFYFGPRSPMLFTVSRGNVASFTGDPHDLVYVCTTLARLQQSGAMLVLTDRNAAKAVAEFSIDPVRWFAEDFIDWELMEQRMWNDVPGYRDRKERRMAECLVHRAVGWSSVMAVGVFDDERAARVAAILEGDDAAPTVLVRPHWYY
jgi:hypothetical protein